MSRASWAEVPPSRRFYLCLEDNKVVGYIYDDNNAAFWMHRVVERKRELRWIESPSECFSAIHACSPTLEKYFPGYFFTQIEYTGVAAVCGTDHTPTEDEP